jgi:RNA polymerase sigma-70 factor (ECF subfamily)
MEEPLDAWFMREIVCHEDMLMRFLARVWPRRDEIADICQETYVRVYEAALSARPHAPKAFLFSTARHLMTDRIRRGRIVSIHAAGENEFLNVLVDEITPERRVGASQELARMARAFDRLPDRYRRVFWLRRVKQLSQKESADRLDLTERTVEKYLGAGLRMLAEYMRTSAPLPRMSQVDSDEPFEGEDDREHGTPEGN